MKDLVMVTNVVLVLLFVGNLENYGKASFIGFIP